MVLGTGGLLFLLLFILPIKRYTPSCGSHLENSLEGPMREPFILFISEGMSEEGYHHIRWGNDLYVRFFYLFGGNKWSLDFHDFRLNAENKIAQSIVHGITIDGRDFPPIEPALKRLKETEAIYGPPKSLPDGQIEYQGGSRFTDDCATLQAALIRVEDMGDDRPRFVPASPLPDGCTPSQLRIWRRWCGRIVSGPAEVAASGDGR